MEDKVNDDQLEGGMQIQSVHLDSISKKKSKWEACVGYRSIFKFYRELLWSKLLFLPS